MPKARPTQRKFPLHGPWFPRGDSARGPHDATADHPIDETFLVSGTPNSNGAIRTMRTISFINQKGGVGKSSSVMHLAGFFSTRGYRTLIVDGDQQFSITQGFLTSEAARALDPRMTIAGLYEEDAPTPARDMILDVGRPGLALLPGSYRLQNFNVPNPWLTGADQFILRDALSTVSDD